MIRGINKRIIEITDTGSELFEKALFFVKSQDESSEQRLKTEAGKLVKAYLHEDSDNYHSGYLRYTESKRKKKTTILIFSLLLLIFGGILTTFLLIF